MKLLIKTEQNMFLFQEIVYDYIVMLKQLWRFPINNKFETNTTSYYIYDSWLDVLKNKIKKTQYTEFTKHIIDIFPNWMITTNIAILKAQKGKNKKYMSKYDLEYIEKHNPSFLIEYENNYDNYIVHLKDKYALLFNESLKFYQFFIDLNYDNLLKVLKKHFIIDESFISEEIRQVLDGFSISNYVNKMLNSYEIMEGDE